MTHVTEIFGFVYIWRDALRKMFYIGSHYGKMNDGYTGSSLRLQRAIAKRPQDFRRKILFKLTEPNRKLLLVEEERWLQMIPPEKLQVVYYNIKRRGTGGNVVEGYTSEQRDLYLKKILETRKRGTQHYKSRSCICEGKFYITLTEAKKQLGWNPFRRLKSPRKYADFYWVDEGAPTTEELEHSLVLSRQNKQKSIEAMRKVNLALSKETHRARTQKTLVTRRANNTLSWTKPTTERKGRRVSIDGVIYNNMKTASKSTNLSLHIIRKRLCSDEFPTYQYI